MLEEEEDPNKPPKIIKSNVVKVKLSRNGTLTSKEFASILKSLNLIGSACIRELDLSSLSLKDKMVSLNRFL